MYDGFGDGSKMAQMERKLAEERKETEKKYDNIDSTDKKFDNVRLKSEG